MKSHLRVVRLVNRIFVCLALLFCLASQAFAETERPCLALPNAVFQSRDSGPIGPSGIRSYRLVRQSEKTFCLSVKLDSSINREFMIWINDNPRRARPLTVGEITAVFPLDWLEEGATVSVSELKSVYDRTSFQERLKLPEFVLRLQQSMLEQAVTKGVVLDQVPEQIDRNRRYLFYLSGYIVHDRNVAPVHPEYGMYQYSKILRTFADSDLVVISEARKQDREIEPYARKVTDQIRQLLKAGVPPKNITVVGASQGSWIAMLASTYLANRGVNFVLIAACSAGKAFLNVVNLHGNILSIFERTDVAQTCSDYRADATGIRDWKEVAVNTGFKHGFLYRPLNEWVAPAVAWANGQR